MRMPAILQRKRNINSASTISQQSCEAAKKIIIVKGIEKPSVFSPMLSKPSSSLNQKIIINQKNIESVLKDLDGVIVLKPYRHSKKDDDPLATNVASSDNEDNPEGDHQNAEESIVQQEDLAETILCDSCDERFEHRSSWIIHKTEKSILRTRAALRDPMIKYTCDMCKKQFVTKGMLARHYRNCGIVELESLPANYRKRRARNPRKSKDNGSAEEGPAACDKCNKVFKKQKYLKVHQTMAHGDHITCQLCDARLDSMSLLKTHMTEVHSGDYTEFCSICGKGFYHRQSLKVHLAAHTRDNKPCVCMYDDCGKSFRHEVYLRKHVQQVHVELRGRKKYHCDECGYETHYKTCFREHMYKHTGEDLVECDVCKKHMRKGYMKIHARIHTGEKPEICEYCGKGFSARKYLAKHRITHTGEKPYQCQICGKRYTQRGTLTLHFRKHHPHDTLSSSRGAMRRKVVQEQVVEEMLAIEEPLEVVVEEATEEVVEKMEEENTFIVIAHEGEEEEVDGRVEVLEEGEIMEDDMQILEEDLDEHEEAQIVEDSVT